MGGWWFRLSNICCCFTCVPYFWYAGPETKPKVIRNRKETVGSFYLFLIDGYRASYRNYWKVHCASFGGERSTYIDGGAFSSSNNFLVAQYRTKSPHRMFIVEIFGCGRRKVFITHHVCVRGHHSSSKCNSLWANVKRENLEKVIASPIELQNTYTCYNETTWKTFDILYNTQKTIIIELVMKLYY